MKKSRSVEINHRLSSKTGHGGPPHPGKSPPFVSPNPSISSSSKSSNTSPNYMKSTNSFEARKEETSKLSSKKIMTLSKAPNIKQSARTTTTCSTTLKNAKFPPNLKLKPGATEAEGRSELRVCKYDHCSLNGHHHNNAPPLKRFMSLRRRILKAQKANTPVVLLPRKAKKLQECKGKGDVDQNEDFFVEIFVPDRVVDTQVSESLSDGPSSVIQSEDANLSDLSFCPRAEDYPPTSVQSPGVSLNEFFCENSDIDWEEEQVFTTNDNNGEIFVQSNYSDDQGKPGSETGSSVDGYLEDFYDYPPYFYDEIVEYLRFTDADSLPDNESTQTGERNIEQPNVAEENDEIDYGPNNEEAEEDSIQAEAAVAVHANGLEDTSAEMQDTIISDLVENIMQAQNEDLDYYQETVETDDDETNVSNYIIGEVREENAAETVAEAREPVEETVTDKLRITEDLETSGMKEAVCMANNDDRDGIDQSEDVAALAAHKMNEATADNRVSTISANSENEIESTEVKYDSNENNVEEDNVASIEDINKIEEASKCISNNGDSDANQELLDNCNKLKRGMRCKKAEDVEKERDFNPRGPNFLDIEPDPEAEKVDLRHQEMDDRRNAEEWMLDHALQKTVNQLTPARKRKVELLVEAFETVLPVPKDEPSTRKNSSGFDHERPIQDCS